MAKTEAVDPALDAAATKPAKAAKVAATPAAAPVAPTVPAQVRALAVAASRAGRHAEEAVLSRIEAHLGSLGELLKNDFSWMTAEAESLTAAIKKALG